MPRAQRIFEQPSRFRATAYIILCDLLGASALVLGLMHPQRDILVREPVKERVATVVAFDISSSMSAESGYFGEGGRLGAVKSAFKELLLAEDPARYSVNDTFNFFRFGVSSSSSRYLMMGNRIGIVTFAGRAMNEMPPTARQSTLLTVIRSLRTVSDPRDNGTNFQAAIEESLLTFEEIDRVRTIILFTDGEADGNAQPIDPELEKAKALGVRIFAIVVGQDPSLVPGSTGITKPYTGHVKHMAKITGGEWFLFGERGKLYGKLADIFSKIEAASYTTVKKTENLQPWCAMSFLLILLVRLMVQFTVRGEKSSP